MRILLLSSLPYIDTNGQPHTSDDRLLLEALIKREAQVLVLPWEAVESAHFPHGSIDLALVRSTWTSHLAPERFAASLDQIASAMPIRNAWPLIRWNLNKYVYLRDLAREGFPIIPTIWLHPGERRPLSRVLAATGWRRAVLKPAIAANSFGTCLFSCEHEPMQVAEQHLDRFLHAGRSMMLQPYLPAVEVQGEHSYVFIGGTFSHAFSKTPFGTHSPGSSKAEPLLMNPPEDELALACRIMRWTGSKFGSEALLCGRVDLMRDEQREIRIMELELIEPLLHLEYADALPRLVDLLLASPVRSFSSRGQKHWLRALHTQEAYR